MAFLNIPINLQSLPDWGRIIATTVNSILIGKTNNTGSFTLTASVGTTTVTLAAGLLGENTVILLSPTTANAATEFGAGTIYVSSRSVTNKTFTLTHVNNAQTDRTFNYVLVG